LALTDTIEFYSRLNSTIGAMKPEKIEPVLSLEEQIRNEAYYLWEREGRPEGKDIIFWLEAEKLVSYRRKVQEIRQRANLSKTGLAKKLGVSLKTIHLWETGKKTPSLDQIHKVEKLCEYETV
jgi:DNA-binding XRE family transcriptional regulator